jgi:hypothetical protein
MSKPHREIDKSEGKTPSHYKENSPNPRRKRLFNNGTTCRGKLNSQVGHGNVFCRGVDPKVRGRTK